MNTYENGPEGMPRVERMTDCTIDWVIHGCKTDGLIRDASGHWQLRDIAHAVAEEVLARLPAWPTPRTGTTASAAGTIDTPEFRRVLGNLLDGDDHSPAAYAQARAPFIAHINQWGAALAEEARREAEAQIVSLMRERDALQKICTRRADRLEAAGLHADCTHEEAAAHRTAGEEAVATVRHHGYWFVEVHEDWEKLGDGTKLYAAQPVSEAAAQADDVCRHCNRKNGYEYDCPIQRMAVLDRLDTLAAPTAQPTPPDDERAAFEAWARSVGYDVSSFNAEDETSYSATFANVAFDAWQARAALRQPGALPDEAGAMKLVNAMIDAWDKDHSTHDAYDAEMLRIETEMRALAAKQAGKPNT